MKYKDKNMKIIVTLVCLVLFYVLSPYEQALCAQKYKPALRTLGIWIQDPQLRLDINLWYPTYRSPKEVNFNPWTVFAALNAPVAEGKYPLIILSHDTAGSRFSYHLTAAWLATQGYIVAAPTHPGDCFDNMDSLFTATQLVERMDNIKAALRLIIADKEVGKYVETNSVGLIGYGTGGTACLLLAGAMPECALLSAWCGKGINKNPYCAPNIKEKMDKMCLTLKDKNFEKEIEIKAVVAISPAYGMLFGYNSFVKTLSPILVISANRDKVNNPEFNSEYIGRLLGSKAHYYEVPSADSGALLSPCPPSIEQDLPELCLSVDEQERKLIHRNINNVIKTFFSSCFQKEEKD